MSNKAATTPRQEAAVATQFTNICPNAVADAFSGHMEAATQCAGLAGDLGRAYADACVTCATEWHHLAHETLACRTPVDIINLQSTSLDSWVYSVTALNNVFEGALKALSEAMKLTIARTTPPPGRFFGAFAD